MNLPPQVGVRFTAEGDEVAAAIQDLTASVKENTRAAKRGRPAQEQFARSLRRVAVRAVALVGGFELLRRTSRFVANTAAEFEQLEARLISVTGSAEKADRAFGLITEFARKTPFEIQNLVEAFTQLSAVGLSPTEEQLRDLGNFAAAFGRDFNDLISGIIRAAQGGTERLREGFGLPLEKEGNRIRVTFRGVTHETEATTGALIEMFQEISRAHFGDAMERQMDTVRGATSNLDDSLSILADRIGDRGLTGEITRLVRFLDDSVASSDELADVLGGTMATGVRTATDALILFVEHGEAALVVLEGFAGAAIGRGAVALGARLVAAAAGASGLGAALLGLLGGPVGAVVTLAGAIAVPLILNLEKASNEAQGLVNIIRSFKEVDAADTPEAIATQIERATGLIGDLEAKIEDLESRRKSTGGLLPRDEVDPQAAAEAEKLRRELAALEEHRRDLVNALNDQAIAQREANEAEQEALTEEQLKKIRSITGGLQDQVDQLRFTERALLEKKLAEAGAGRAATEHALALFDEAEALRTQEQALKDTEAQLERLPQVRAQLLAAQGDEVGALRLELQQEYDELIAALLSRADFAGVQLVQKLFDVRLARARLEELEQTFGQARENLQLELERIELEHQSGAITAAEAQERIREVYQRQISTLNELLPRLRAAAEATGDPAAIARVRALELELTRLGIAFDRIGDNVQDFRASARQALEQDLANWLTDGIQEAQNLGEAFADLAISIVQTLQRIAAELAARAILSAIFPPLALLSGGGEVTAGGEGMAEGGPVRGPGGPKSDTVPAMLSPGEYVLQASAVKRVGVEALDAINAGMRTPTIVRRGGHFFQQGGLVEEVDDDASRRPGRKRSKPESATPNVNINVEVHAPESDPALVARHAVEEITEAVRHSRSFRSMFPGG